MLHFISKMYKSYFCQLHTFMISYLNGKTNNDFSYGFSLLSDAIK